MRKHLLVLAMMGLGVVGCSSMHGQAKDKGEDDEGNEQKIAFAQVPEAAQKTLTDESKGNNIDSVDKELKHGMTVYEADTVIYGKNYEIKVAQDGTLVSKKLDVESKEKGEKNEKNENEKGDKD
jgi:hypothetical protein